ncbi:primosomal protein N' [Candidatus Saccharibacteria bacterium]|nr:primosomal protein N' [Candidatus Saccharibacteria bacterium]
MFYYEIGVGADRHWGNSVFTYSSKNRLAKGSVVRIEFGKQKKNGLVLKQITKPDFNTKDVVFELNSKINEPTLRFIDWFAGFYCADYAQVYSQFIPAYLTKFNIKMSNDNDEIIKPRAKEPELNKDQLAAIKQLYSTKKSSVLHGITGSGKTRAYIKMILDNFAKGKNCLFLYPEISLTPQIITEISRYVPVFNVHSNLPDSERSKIWHKIANHTGPYVVAGPRSALFLPHDNLGLIIVDEFHESSYKQETGVRYNSILVSAGLSRIHNSKLILGSATPSITETEYVVSGGGNIVCMHNKAIINDQLKKEIAIIDIKNRKNFKKHSILSDTLISKIDLALSKKQQVLLFLNRRGTAKSVTCNSEDCDWKATCNACELPLTYHHDIHKLLCHTCGRSSLMPTVCPKCGKTTLLKTLGGKAIYEDLIKLFPGAKIGRYDSDNDINSSFSKDYDDIVNGKINILIGTQQIIKGLDLPKLSTIGLLNADLSLNFPDFSSDERTFQLLTQAIGRVGRGHSEATIVIQSSQPDSALIRNALDDDWHVFRDNELSSRLKHGFPPKNYYAKLIFRAKSENASFKKATDYLEKLKTPNNVSLLGPIKSYYQKRGNFYYCQIVIYSKSRNDIVQLVKNMHTEAIIDLDPTSLL